MGAPRARRPRRWAYRTLTATGLLLLAGVGAFQLEATLWTTHSERVGRALVHQFLNNRALFSPVTDHPLSPPAASLAPCSSASTSPSEPVRGLLEIPRLRLVAPVEQGTGDAVLNVAVGHDPYSVWPGRVGTSVLEAHDVSYFVNLAQLKPGDEVRYVSPCVSHTFRISSHTVVREGSPVYNTPGPTITLVTCWPTNALWFTPDRYLVTASEVSVADTGGNASPYAGAAQAPEVPVPSELASQGVTLATYSLPMGAMSLGGSPDPAWAQSTDPLLVEESAVEGYIAGVRSLGADRLDWWRSIAPTVAAPSALVGAANPGYLTPLDVQVSAVGEQPTAVTLSNTVAIRGGGVPGRYSVTVTETISRGTLHVSSWAMEPA